MASQHPDDDANPDGGRVITARGLGNDPGITLPPLRERVPPPPRRFRLSDRISQILGWRRGQPLPTARTELAVTPFGRATSTDTGGPTPEASPLRRHASIAAVIGAVLAVGLLSYLVVAHLGAARQASDPAPAPPAEPAPPQPPPAQPAAAPVVAEPAQIPTPGADAAPARSSAALAAPAAPTRPLRAPTPTEAHPSTRKPPPIPGDREGLMAPSF